MLGMIVLSAIRYLANACAYTAVVRLGAFFLPLPDRTLTTPRTRRWCSSTS